MRRTAGSLRRRIFGIDPIEVNFDRRGFDVRDPQAVLRLERIGRFFVAGYHAALREPDPVRLGRALQRAEMELQGFAFEGAGMALALLDRVTPWRRTRLPVFLRGPGAPHAYMVTIGAGWAWARLGSRLGFRTGSKTDGALADMDPLLRWLAFDGYGFHEGFFQPGRTIERQARPAAIRGHARRVFDSGVGRSLWFVSCADPEAVARRIGSFEPARQADLWAGVGLACSYAGCASDDGIDRLRELSAKHRSALAQGAAFAAKARLRADLPAEHTARAVERICRCSVELAAKVCDAELPASVSPLDRNDAIPSFELWRSGIRANFERALHAEGQTQA